MKKDTDSPIAIIGMGSLFAQASQLSEYWRLLYKGIDAVTEPPETHAHLNDYYDPDPKKPDHIYCKRGGFLKPIPFDPTEFGIPPNALEATDTSQLLALAVAKMALNDAGYGENGRPFAKEKTSVILGVTGTQELVVTLGSRLGHPKWRRALNSADVSEEKSQEVVDHISNSYVSWQENSFPGLLGNVVAGRLCNRLDLGGTNCVVDAACASSLSAVHLALLELASGRSNMVITGGVDTLNDIFMHMCFSKTGVLSKSGNARPFSKDADGTVLGEGVGLLVLKRLEDALSDQDRVYAVIKGLGTSSDGKSQSIYAPRSQGQMRALETAYRRADINPATIDLIEAHGTGTRVGDQVEFESLCNIYSPHVSQKGRCCLGSVKSMIGHTKAAAGAAGLIKTALCLYYKVLPPTIKATEPDPQLKIDDSPFYLSDQSRPWAAPKDHPRRAAVSAFGFGGSNFHLVLEEYKSEKDTPAWDGSINIFAFSGSTPSQIANQIKQLVDDQDLWNLPGMLANAAHNSRKAFQSTHPHRFLLIVDPFGDVSKRLKTSLEIFSADQVTLSRLDPSYMFYGGPEPEGKVAMVFPGQGSQYINMARHWLCMFPEGLSILNQADAIWSGQNRLSEIIFPPPTGNRKEKKAQQLRLRHTHAAQMALAVIEAAMLAVLRRFKISADVYCGHSYGELSALFAAGWYDLNTLLNLSDARGRSMAQADKAANGDSGGMLAVNAPLAEIEQLAQRLRPNVVLANHNSPTQGVLSGTKSALETAKAHCAENGWRSVELPVAAAFHSPIIQPALAPFTQATDSAILTPAKIPVYSNVSAAAYPMDARQAKDLLQKQMVSPVNFVGTINHMHQNGVTTFIEVGPKRVLAGLIKEILAPHTIDIFSLDQSTGPNEGLYELARVLCQLASKGAAVDLASWEAAPPLFRKPRMQVMLSGANHVSPQTKAKAATSDKPPKREESRLTDASDASFKPQTRQAQLPAAALTKPPQQKEKSSFKKPEPVQAKMMIKQQPKKQNAVKHTLEPHVSSAASSQPQFSNNSLAVLQQGILSMQALHLQTTQAHQKFLEIQAEAGRTLQEVMRQAQHLSTAPLDSGGYIQPSVSLPEKIESTPVQTAVQKPEPATPQIDSIPAALNTAGNTILDAAPKTENVQIKAPAKAFKSVSEAPKSTTANNASSKLRTTLLNVVSELTGYPDQMLELDMDIESDLGIDSIKRVEILSTLEERLPGIPTITPDMLGTLKTLGQIIDFLEDSPDNTSTGSAPSTDSHDGNGELIQQTLLAVVSELTGYPAEMLEPDMDIESDLGIDSIKRVEILSTLEERLPQLPSITPDLLGTIKTLRQIGDFLNSSPSKTATPPATTAGVSNSNGNMGKIRETLIVVVSELTGYPPEMLDFSMDIESDLGIDSIKRVEILSTLEERLPGVPAVTPDMLGTLKTLGQIIEFMESASGKAPESTSTATTADPETDSIQNALLSVVSELTGYPVEMLEPGMDIEADLGIDSIKRVEILSTIEERMPKLPSVTPDMLGSLKTIGHIVEFLSGSKQSAPVTITSADTSLESLPQQKKTDSVQPSVPSPPVESVMRKRIAITEINRPIAEFKAFQNSSKGIYITEDTAGLSQAIAEELKAKGCAATVIKPDIELNPKLFEDACGLILTAPISPLNAFKLTQAFGTQLDQQPQRSNSLLATISRIDGAFGFNGRKIIDPFQGALAGLTKTAYREWQGVACRAVDVDPNWQDHTQIARTVLDFIFENNSNVPLEIGLSEQKQITLTLQEAPVQEGKIAIDPKDVVVITGGGRGVTAEAALALAHKTPCRMVLLGRSSPPEKEPLWLKDAKHPAEMKKAILAHEFNNQKASPKELEKRYRKWQTGRQINATLSKLAENNVNAYYFQLDVRNTMDMSAIFAKIRREIGPIKAIIHGAGVLHDRLIVEKDLNQFEMVYGTKVDALLGLLDETKHDNLKYLVLFSSVSARMGNKGQVDYAMANEVLNKIAWQQQTQRSHCKVISINWGPWDGGMVDASLKREFEKNGIGLIPLKQGAKAMVAEMADNMNAPAEVVIGATFDQTETIASTQPKNNQKPLRLSPATAKDPQPSLSSLFQREIDLKQYPILSDHILGGRPVVPLALITEWLSHSALHENPGLIFHGIDALRLLAGIKLDQDKKLIRMMAGKAHRSGNFYEVDVEIRNGKIDGRDVIHSRATALLASQLPKAPRYDGPKITPKHHCLDKSMGQIYEDILFHGKRLKAIESIFDFSSKGMAARLSAAPDPYHWMTDPLRSQWILDPLVLDGAFQMAIIWCHEQLGKRSLPSFAKTYRQYQEFFPEDGVTALLNVHKTQSTKMIGDFTFLDQNNNIIAQILGYEAIMDEALDKAFSRKNAA